MERLNRSEIDHLIPLLKKVCIIIAVVLSALVLAKDAYFYESYIVRMTLFFTVPRLFLFFFWIRFKLDEQYLFKINISGIDALVIILTFMPIPLPIFHSSGLLFLVYTAITTKNTIYRLVCAGLTLYLLDIEVLISDSYLSPGIAIILAIVLSIFRFRAVRKFKELESFTKAK